MSDPEHIHSETEDRGPETIHIVADTGTRDRDTKHEMQPKPKTVSEPITESETARRRDHIVRGPSRSREEGNTLLHPMHHHHDTSTCVDEGGQRSSGPAREPPPLRRLTRSPNLDPLSPSPPKPIISFSTHISSLVESQHQCEQAARRLGARRGIRLEGWYTVDARDPRTSVCARENHGQPTSQSTEPRGSAIRKQQKSRRTGRLTRVSTASCSSLPWRP